MNAVHATARKALRRRLLARFVRALGATLATAAALSLGLIVVDRLFSLEWNVWLLAGAPAGAALLGALIAAMWRRESLLNAAVEVDRALQLRDRLGSALALEQESPDDPFTTLAIEDAQRIAGEVRVKDATPILFGRSWVAWPAVGALAVASAIFLPALDLAHQRAEEAQDAKEIALREDAQRDIADARTAVAPEDISTVDLATPTDLEILEQLEEQLASGAVDPNVALATAASALDRAAENLDQSAETDDARTEALRETLSSVGGANSPDEMSPLAEAFSSGDFEAAQKLLEEQRQLLDKLDQAEREKLADELEKIADALEQTPGDEPSELDASPATEQLRKLGMTEPEIDKILDENDPEKVREQLREQGIDEPAVEKLADELEQEQQKHEAQEQAQEDANELGESLRDAADEARRNPDEPTTDTASPEETRPDNRDASQSDSSTDQDSTQDATDQPKPAPQSSPENDAQNESDRTQAGDEQTGSDQTPRPEPDLDDPTEDKPTPGEQRQPNQEPTPSQSPSPSDSPSDNETNSSSPNNDASQEDGVKPDVNDTSGKTPGVSPNREPGDEKGFENAKRLLKKFSERQQQSKDKRQSAEDARRQARKLLDKMSPQQQEQLRRWANELSREKSTQQPAPSSEKFTTTPLDLRQQTDSPDRTIHQWFNPDSADRDPNSVSYRSVDQQLRQAAQGAERAIEEQAVHRRYNEIIKRYFDAANKNTAPPARAPASAKPEKKDSGS